MRLITACFARVPQRWPSRIYIHFLLMFHEVRLISKTRNQLNKSLGGMWVVSSWKSMVSVRLWRVGLVACPVFPLPVRGHWRG